jgi:hypothetical protein
MSLSVLKHNLGTIIQLMLSFIKRNTKKEQYFSKFLHILSTLNRKTYVLHNDIYIYIYIYIYNVDPHRNYVRPLKILGFGAIKNKLFILG